MSARRAEPRDQTRVAELLEHARAEVVHKRGGVELVEALGERRDLVRGIGDETSNPTVVTFVAYAPHDDTAIGLAVLEQRREPPSGLIAALFVEREHRRNGHGTELVRAVAEYVQRAGAARLDIVALPGDRATKSLLESLGFRARLLVMSSDPGEAN